MPRIGRRSTTNLIRVILLLGAVVPSTVLAQMRGQARLTPPESGAIQVAFALSAGATMIDFTGPWEVFQDVSIPERGNAHVFRLFTVAETLDPVRASAGMRILPDYTFDNAPQPQVIVVPAQSGSPSLHAWLRKASVDADLTMAVCTGAFHLARAGLLDGRKATTHHDFYGQLARAHPRIDVQRGLRWVDSPRIATAGGLTSGIDLALRVVARYFGDSVARRTAEYMEYQSDGWLADRGLWDATTTEQASQRVATPLPPVLRGLDPVLLTRGEEHMGRDDLALTRGSYRYSFATQETYEQFQANPTAYAIQFGGACAAMTRSGAPPGSGDPDRFLVHQGKIYVFASTNCRDSFAMNPASYLR